MSSGPFPDQVHTAGGSGDRRALLSDGVRDRLHRLLSDGPLETGRLMARLREMRTLENIPAFRAALHQLTHLSQPDDRAERLMGELLAHRDGMHRALGRDPGLQVAAIDFLTNVRSMMSQPTVLEWSQLEETERFAVTDPLTDLFNRRHFEEAFERELARSKRHRLDLALLMLDLDSFKSVNDLYGHPLGDGVLRRAGQVIRRSVRESDTACRFGGEEFTVILPETDRLGAHVLGERVRREVERDFSERDVDGRLVAMTISGGISCYPEDGDRISSLIDCADLALYAAKSAGRNRIVIFHGERRRAVRYPTRSSSRATLSAREGEIREVHPINLSRHGALVRTRDSFAINDAVELTLSRQADLRRLPGQIVRVEPSPEGGPRRRVAIHFADPLEDDGLFRHVRQGQVRPRRGASR